MTDQHPITPPPELVSQLRREAPHGIGDAGVTRELFLITAAYRWGADQELEACVEWLQDPDLNVDTYKLRAARRPKPLSLKELALEVLERSCFVNQEDATIIRHALEQLPND